MPLTLLSTLMRNSLRALITKRIPSSKNLINLSCDILIFEEDVSILTSESIIFFNSRIKLSEDLS